MKWTELSSVWQKCFELAWEAHIEGSNPIAAVVVDAQEQIVSTGKSAVKANLSGVHTSNCEIAHAEVNALLGLDNRIHDKAKAQTYTLYVTLEPCPLCFSALYMSDVNKLTYAAKDRFGGSTNLLGTTAYLSRKAIQITGPVDHLGAVSIFMNVYSDVLRGLPQPNVVHTELAEDYPSVVALALQLAPTDSLGIGREAQVNVVYDRITAAIGSS